jgi:hypothetical protein
MQNLIPVNTEDIRDWALCPVRVWWRRNGISQDLVGKATRQTGQFLVRKCTQTAVKGYYQLQGQTSKGLSVEQIAAAVWGRWLQGWGLAALVDPLMEYSKQRQSILDMFGERGQIRDANGNIYGRPMLTRLWIEHAVNSGLATLRSTIDAQQTKAGIGYLKLPDDQTYSGPTGLADAFADSMLIADRLKSSLPENDEIVGIDASTYADLLSVRLMTVADLVCDAGIAPRKVGRPREDEPIPPHAYVYELFLYDDELPQPQILARDIRLLALMQSYPADNDPATTMVSTVRVRHLKSGKVQEYTPNAGGSADILESMARAFVKGVRAGVYIPRSLVGWEACAGCDFRSLCYSGNSDVAALYNPPLSAQIQASQLMSAELRKIVQGNGIQASEKTREILRAFLHWLDTSPGVTPESAEWMLDNLFADSDQKGAAHG